MADTIHQTGQSRLLQFAHKPAGLALLCGNAACPLPGRYTALFQAFVLRPDSRGTDLKRLKILRGYPFTSILWSPESVIPDYT